MLILLGYCIQTTQAEVISDRPPVILSACSPRSPENCIHVKPLPSGWRFWWLRWTVGRQRRGHKAEDMASKEEASRSEGEEYVYRISTAEEWESLQKDGAIFGGDLDKSSGFIHLSKLNQVKSTLHNFFLNTNLELYLLQIDAKKLGDGLIYEVVDGSNSFPHFYGPSRSFVPLPLDAVVKAEKITVSDGQFICSLLN
ncbi:uncharacterized protein LOC122725188 [Manihot esculenta]|nr:uncharacterized protein LOC122725188 [Manihot esculenta]XP_043818133.1 uncharacterized protein LOC122725188 [Manihot esculenta]